MKRIEIKENLKNLEEIHFLLPNEELVPKHFHVTEVGIVNKRFIECGGIARKEEAINFQLWNANDYDHRLHPEKLLSIIELSEKTLKIDNRLPIEVEYQGQGIEKYGLELNRQGFFHTTEYTDCSAKESCGIPTQKPKIKATDLNAQAQTYIPSSGFC